MANERAGSVLEELFVRIVNDSVDRREQGTRFERAVEFFLSHDPSWTERMDHVWMWDDADNPMNDGRQDTGIDLVAEDIDGSYWAIQAKCYSKSRLDLRDVSTFFTTALADPRYEHLMIADASLGITSNLEDYIDSFPVKNPSRELVRLDIDTMRDANLDWNAFDQGIASSERTVFEPRPHQREAIDRVKQELADHDRCSLIMACGTGKTLTSLRLCEEMLPEGGTVLFLAPSISLVAQTMRNWVNQVRGRINAYVVCSNGNASKVDEEAYGQLTDIPFPATTNARTIAQRFRRKDNALNVVFSTYQSIQVIHDAQQLGLLGFDMIICDEAHRTTGVMDDESAFREIHKDSFVRGTKRVYMTATPRIFSSDAKSKAQQGAIEIASMDDETVYGRVAYRLSFGKAVDAGLLTDYKIVVMQVSEQMMGREMQRMYGAKDSEIPLDDAAKFVGCWKALFDRRHARSITDIATHGKHTDEAIKDDSKRVLHHAIAFAKDIKSSKALTDKFRTVIDDYTANLEENEENQLLVKAGREVLVDIDHVDGTMDAQTRKTKLDWLAADTGENECRILSNARCLAEGIDVPDLDAIIYLNSRRSKVDIIQSVGRVMRKAPGKQYGYIIIPVVVPLDADPDTILSSGAYKPVWDAVTALRSHDERLDAIINAASLGDDNALNRIIEVDVLDASKLKTRGTKTNTMTPVGGPDTTNTNPTSTTDNDVQKHGKEEAIQAELDLSIARMAQAINAQIVRKCGTKIYWGEWTGDIADITQARAARIARLVDSEAAREPFQTFLKGLRDSLNPGYTETDAIAVLAQHEITKPIFQTLFTNKNVLDNNPIVKGLDRALNALYDAGLSKDIGSFTLRELYASVHLAASQLESDVAKQNLIKEIYNDFFTKAFKDTADSLGIVYTPVEVVDAQLHMVQRALTREFGQSLGDKGVHILDGFAGTGTYISRLIEDESLISDADLPYKYEHDLHSNEIVPLAATIMDINIEQSYHKRIGGEYKAFPGALLTDTFQMHENDDQDDLNVFAENTQRVREQKALPIRIIVGNPPYRAGDSDNTGNQNTKYPSLDSRIEKTYVANSEATNNNSLYDHYIRAFRWASDRIGESGIVCFVSNGGWLTGASGAGVRRCFVNEFNDIYVYNLRGNQRTQGEESRREGGKIFASGSRATIAITMLVKNPESSNHGVIHYHDIGDYLTREDKLNILKDAVDIDPEWTTLIPDKYGDWLNQRDDTYYMFIPIGLNNKISGTPNGLFEGYSRGSESDRDAHVINFSKETVAASVRNVVNEYTRQLTLSPKSRSTAGSLWSRTLRQKLRRGMKLDFVPSAFRVVAYRPFCKQWLYADSSLVDYPGIHPAAFPYAGAKNIELAISGIGAPYPFSVLAFDEIPALTPYAGNGQCFPLYWYEKASDDDGTLFSGDGAVDEHGYIRHDAITDTGLAVFRTAYPNQRITKEDIFYYVYGVLHSPEYRRRFANNLKKELPRIPLAKDFKAFMQAGRALADLHLNYETVDRYPVEEIGDASNPGRTEKMSYPNKIKDPETGKKTSDYTVLKVADNLIIRGIPLRAYEYVVNGKSALGWLIDRYQVRADKKSGIVNDPNDYSDDPRYIVDLVERVITVSLKTLDIIGALPALEELPQLSNWPDEWNQ